MLYRSKLGLANGFISWCVLLPFEFFCFTIECICRSARLPDTIYVFIWRKYVEFVSFLLFRFYFRSVCVRDPYGTLAGSSDKKALVFASNHPTGMEDRRFVQHVVPNCHCIVAVGSNIRRRIEHSLHIVSAPYRRKQRTARESDAEHFSLIIECLCKSNAIWISVNGGKEIHPYIEKVHTGAMRIAILARKVLEANKDLFVVPTSISFECDKQIGSDVLVEFGEPIQIEKEWSIEDRQCIREKTCILKDRLKCLAHYLADDKNISGSSYSSGKKKSTREKKEAFQEWLRLRIMMSIEFLRNDTQELHISWKQRVDLLRKLKCPPDETLAVYDAFMEQFDIFAIIYTECVGNPPFKHPGGFYWDTTVPLMAVPKRNIPSNKLSIDSLRNFGYGALQWERDILSCSAGPKQELLLSEFRKLKSIAQLPLSKW